MKCENFMTSLEFPIMGAGIESYTKQVQGSYRTFDIRDFACEGNIEFILAMSIFP